MERRKFTREFKLEAVRLITFNGDLYVDEAGHFGTAGARTNVAHNRRLSDCVSFRACEGCADVARAGSACSLIGSCAFDRSASRIGKMESSPVS
jgi:hypothetical protein